MTRVVDVSADVEYTETCRTAALIEFAALRFPTDRRRSAARLDLDDYNNNSHEGLHTTSMAAAWMNVIYGFGGLRTDSEHLFFRPSIPESWKSFSFHLQYRGSLLKVGVNHEQVECAVVEGEAVTIRVFDDTYAVNTGGVAVPMRARPTESVGALTML